MSKKKIFISYSRQDLAFVTRLVDGLRKKGETVWFDSHIRSGDQWDNSIEQEIRGSDIFIIVLSDSSVTSHNVMDEVSLAKDLGKIIIPIKIRECDLPMRLRRDQYIDFFKHGVEWGFDRLMHDINQDEGRKPPPRPKPRPRETKKSNGWVPFVIGGFVFVAIFVLIAVFVEAGEYDTTDDYIIPTDDYIDPIEDDGEFTQTGMVIYQNPMGQVTVNKMEGGYPQVGDLLFAMTPLEVYTLDRYANGDYIAVGGQVKVLEIFPMTQDGFIFMNVRYKEPGL